MRIEYFGEVLEVREEFYVREGEEYKKVDEGYYKAVDSQDGEIIKLRLMMDVNKISNEEKEVDFEDVQIQGQLESTGIGVKIGKGLGIGIEVEDVDSWDKVMLINKVDDILGRLYEEDYTKERKAEGVVVRDKK